MPGGGGGGVLRARIVNSQPRAQTNGDAVLSHESRFVKLGLHRGDKLERRLCALAVRGGSRIALRIARRCAGMPWTGRGES